MTLLCIMQLGGALHCRDLLSYPKVCFIDMIMITCTPSFVQLLLLSCCWQYICASHLLALPDQQKDSWFLLCMPAPATLTIITTAKHFILSYTSLQVPIDPSWSWIPMHRLHIFSGPTPSLPLLSKLMKFQLKPRSSSWPWNECAQSRCLNKAQLGHF